MFHKVKNVTPISDFNLSVQFSDCLLYTSLGFGNGTVCFIVFRNRNRSDIQHIAFLRAQGGHFLVQRINCSKITPRDVYKRQTLQSIHKYLFEDIYDFAGKLRTVNLAKGNFRFAPLMYLEAALANIDSCLLYTSSPRTRARAANTAP